MTSIDKLLEQQEALARQQKEIAAKVRAAKQAQARKKAAVDAKLYTVLGKAVAQQHGGSSRDIEERVAHAAQQLGIELPVRKATAPKAQAQPAAGSQPEHVAQHAPSHDERVEAGPWQQSQH